MKKILTIILAIAFILLYNISYINNIIDNIENKHSNVNDVVKENDEKNKVNNFYNLKIGDNINFVRKNIGNPARIDKSEYDFNWYVYNQFGYKFCMVGINRDEKVVALYSNAVNSSQLKNIKINDSKNVIEDMYKPLKYIQKGNISYIINSKGEYDILDYNDTYVTVFYDKHDKNKITSYFIVKCESEDSLSSIFPKYSSDLAKALEMEIIDLTNSVRLKRKLRPLKYSQKAAICARKHCIDMKANNYFDHVDKKGDGPGERMTKEGIFYMVAGENIAAGQFNAIYAHEAWMNSLGHKKNILGDYNYIGVGVVFGGAYNMYYGQNFYR